MFTCMLREAPAGGRVVRMLMPYTYITYIHKSDTHNLPMSICIVSNRIIANRLCICTCIYMLRDAPAGASRAC